MDSAEDAPQHETPTFGSPDLPQKGMGTIVGDPPGATMTGPRNPVLESQLEDVRRLREDAELRGWQTEVERHSRVVSALEGHVGRLGDRDA